jgi:periplasmic divalent cation tolerance protein
MSDAGDFAVVLITAASAEQAAAIARPLVGERLAACVNIVPGVRSIYRWEGRVQDDAEILLIAKTRRALVARLASRVKELHGYSVPETIALPLVGGSESYLAWLEAETDAA